MVKISFDVHVDPTSSFDVCKAAVRVNSEGAGPYSRIVFQCRYSIVIHRYTIVIYVRILQVHDINSSFECSLGLSKPQARRRSSTLDVKTSFLLCFSFSALKGVNSGASPGIGYPDLATSRRTATESTRQFRILLFGIITMGIDIVDDHRVMS